MREAAHSVVRLQHPASVVELRTHLLHHRRVRLPTVLPVAEILSTLLDLLRLLCEYVGRR